MQPQALRPRQEVRDGQQHEEHHDAAKHPLKANDLQRRHGEVGHEEVLKRQLRRLHGLRRRGVTRRERVVLLLRQLTCSAWDVRHTCCE
jgi:hypothetical protein